MAPVESFKHLTVWQEAMELAAAVYELTKGFPASEQYVLTAQIRRAAVSVASNIAEGHRRTRPGYLNHVQIALGSLAEVETQILLAVKVGICSEHVVEPARLIIERTGKLLHALQRSLRQ